MFIGLAEKGERGGKPVSWRNAGIKKISIGLNTELTELTSTHCEFSGGDESSQHFQIYFQNDKNRILSEFP